MGFDPKDPYRTPTAKEVLKDMGQRGISYAKNFAIVGAMFSCTECVVESVSNDLRPYCVTCDCALSDHLSQVQAPLHRGEGSARFLLLLNHLSFSVLKAFRTAL